MSSSSSSFTSSSDSDSSDESSTESETETEVKLINRSLTPPAVAEKTPPPVEEICEKEEPHTVSESIESMEESNSPLRDGIEARNKTPEPMQVIFFSNKFTVYFFFFFVVQYFYLFVSDRFRRPGSS